MEPNSLAPALLEELGQLSTCVVASAIETFQVRLRNVGFASSAIRAMFPEMPPMAGYAATARIRSSAPPMEGKSYYDRTEWWNELLKVPAPRVVVIEDLDDPPGLGGFVGVVHARILKKLGCVGLVTNGGVRDLPGVRKIGFPMFAGNIAVSHAYAHVFDFGGTVQVGGLQVHRGDLVHADLHGVQTIPESIAAKVPVVAGEILKKRQILMDLCDSPEFTLEKLQRKVREIES
jgi:4-hydroxy-4-methyl-2-oxoglutarate aldolase